MFAETDSLKETPTEIWSTSESTLRMDFLNSKGIVVYRRVNRFTSDLDFFPWSLFTNESWLKTFT